MVHPGQHPLSGCQGKDHVGTESALLCSSLPAHSPSCSSVKSCLQILEVSDCLHIPSLEAHLSIFLIPLFFFFFSDTFGLPNILCQRDPEFNYVSCKEALIFISFKPFSDYFIRNTLPLAM